MANDSESISQLPWCGGSITPLLGMAVNSFKESTGADSAKLHSSLVGMLLFSPACTLGTIWSSGFYSLLSSSALSRCSELGLQRDSESSYCTTSSIDPGTSQGTPTKCDLFRCRTRLRAFVSWVSLPSSTPQSQPHAFRGATTGSLLFLSSSCWTDIGRDVKKSSALFLLPFRAQKSWAAAAAAAFLLLLGLWVSGFWKVGKGVRKLCLCSVKWLVLV